MVGTQRYIAENNMDEFPVYMAMGESVKKPNLQLVHVSNTIDDKLLGYNVKKINSTNEIVPGQKYFLKDSYGTWIKEFKLKEIDTESSKYILLVPAIRTRVGEVAFRDENNNYMGKATTETIPLRYEDLGNLYRIMKK